MPDDGATNDSSEFRGATLRTETADSDKGNASKFTKEVLDLPKTVAPTTANIKMEVHKVAVYEETADPGKNNASKVPNEVSEPQKTIAPTMPNIKKELNKVTVYEDADKKFTSNSGKTFLGTGFQTINGFEMCNILSPFVFSK